MARNAGSIAAFCCVLQCKRPPQCSPPPISYSPVSYAPNRNMVALPLNGVQHSSSSPTIQSHRLSLLTIPAIDLHTSLLSVSMDDDSLRMEDRSAQDHSPVDSSFYDLQPPEQQANHVKPEDIMSRLFSKEHLHFILGDHIFFYRFSSFLNCYSSHLVLALVRYLEMRTAIKAIEYANAVARRVR
jgi:hypothetical protein